MRNRLLIGVVCCWAAISASAATDQRPTPQPASSTAKTAAAAQKSVRQQFVLDVVQSAVALPQPDPQDRLRVLYSAVTVASTIAARLARTLSREGVSLELELIRSGEKPAVSLFAAGNVDCAAATGFVQALPAASVQAAEMSILGALSLCPKQTLEPARQKLETALNQGTLAARPLLAVMEATGANSAWSQTQFGRMFGALPKEYEQNRAESPNFAAMYVRVAPQVGQDTARDAGLQLLTWLSHLSLGSERNLAVNMLTASMRQVLGPDKYAEALRGDVVASGVAQTAGQPGAVQHPPEDNVSVLDAMSTFGRSFEKDRSEAIAAMPVSKRAREAAASGFASGQQGDRLMADRYFDIAFSALDELWRERAIVPNAPSVVEEVSEAAAQVDAVAALSRVQRLRDPSAQAIGMLAVARTVQGRQ